MHADDIELSSSAVNTSVLFKDDGKPALVEVDTQVHYDRGSDKITFLIP